MLNGPTLHDFSLSFNSLCCFAKTLPQNFTRGSNEVRNGQAINGAINAHILSKGNTQIPREWIPKTTECLAMTFGSPVPLGKARKYVIWKTRIRGDSHAVFTESIEEHGSGKEGEQCATCGTDKLPLSAESARSECWRRLGEKELGGYCWHVPRLCQITCLHELYL
jgi:hypothetical protein